MEIIRRIFQKTARRFYYLEKNVIEIDSIEELTKLYKWDASPLLDRHDIYNYDFVEDVNQRRLRDAESLAVVMKNSNPKIALEIGTSTGLATALMAINAPGCTVYTVNIPPEEILNGEGGKLTTIALEKEKIGSEFRKRELKNIVQIYANTARWEPNIGTIDVAFIDGCHDTEFVYNDSRKILKNCRKGSFILWHDFNPELVKKFNWIDDVCYGVEKLYRSGYLKERIYHVKNSWIGIYRV